jgi:NAD(P)-dependent dehydrogenase (short-subunit alcohol dehydrogenase family)
MIRFDNRVAIVTGAGIGLGRSHALGLAARGAKVVVNDLGVDASGVGCSSAAANAVVDEIEALGGEAFANGADVSNSEQVINMINQTMQRWGRIDILVNNAGILRDKSFAKMSFDDFSKVIDVHLTGSANCCHSVWPIMQEQKYGRIVLTSSASGLYGNFGQSNYGAAKAAMVGLMNVLHHEGVRDDIRVNTLAPSAATRMTHNLVPETALDLLAPEKITPGLLYLVSEDSPTKTILSAGAGCFAQTRIFETEGIMIQGDVTPETVAQNWKNITDPAGQTEIPDAFTQTRKYAKRAAEAYDIKLNW